MDARGPAAEAASLPAFREVSEFLDDVDAWFSTFRDDSPVHLLRTGQLAEAAAPVVVREVLAGCRAARELTEGAFDPWAMPGGRGPERLRQGLGGRARLRDAGGGRAERTRTSTREATSSVEAPPKPGAPGGSASGIPSSTTWSPRVVEVFDGAVATSGTYERGLHVLDPRTGSPATERRVGNRGRAGRRSRGRTRDGSRRRRAGRPGLAGRAARVTGPGTSSSATRRRSPGRPSTEGWSAASRCATL